MSPLPTNRCDDWHGLVQKKCATIGYMRSQGTNGYTGVNKSTNYLKVWGYFYSPAIICPNSGKLDENETFTVTSSNTEEQFLNIEKECDFRINTSYGIYYHQHFVKIERGIFIDTDRKLHI